MLGSDTHTHPFVVQQCWQFVVFLGLLDVQLYWVPIDLRPLFRRACSERRHQMLEISGINVQIIVSVLL
jgi:hypothetical protein